MSDQNWKVVYNRRPDELYGRWIEIGPLLTILVPVNVSDATEQQRIDEAQRVCRAVNCHADLLAACKAALLKRACDKETRDMLRAAIAKAEGQL